MPTSAPTRSTPLSRLIRDRREGLGMTVRDVEAKSGTRADKRGPRVSKTRVHGIESGKVTLNLSEEVKRGLSVALDIPVATINEAITQTVGLEQLHTDRAELVALMDRAEHLDPGKRDAFLKAANALLDGLRSGD